MFYLPLLDPHANMEQDDDDFLQDNQDDLHHRLAVSFKKSVLQIIREVSLILFILLLVLQRVMRCNICYNVQLPSAFSNL